MEYFKATWIHELEDEPFLFYSEFDDNRNEIRKIEIYKDDSFGIADERFEFGGTRLGRDCPTIEEINNEPEFIAHIITKEEFEKIWNEYLNFLNTR